MCFGQEYDFDSVHFYFDHLDTTLFSSACQHLFHGLLSLSQLLRSRIFSSVCHDDSSICHDGPARARRRVWLLVSYLVPVLILSPCYKVSYPSKLVDFSDFRGGEKCLVLVTLCLTLFATALSVGAGVLGVITLVPAILVCILPCVERGCGKGIAIASAVFAGVAACLMLVGGQLILSDEFVSTYCGQEPYDDDDSNCDLIVGTLGFVSGTVWLVCCVLLILLSYIFCKAGNSGVTSRSIVFNPTSTTVTDEEAPSTDRSKSQTKVTETYSAGVKKTEKIVTDENGHQTITYTEEAVPPGDTTAKEPQAIALIEAKD